MKIMLRAAIAALSIASIGPALADGGEGTVANTQFTELPGVVAQAQVPNAPTYAQNGQQNRQAQTQQAQSQQAQSQQAQSQQAQSGQAAHGYGVYSTQSGRGTWLFPPNANQGANS
jgi:hypothetical protein